MSRRPRRRQRPSPTRPSVLPALEQFEPRYFPNDLTSLLGASVLGGGLAFLGQAGSALPRREPRDGDGGASAYPPTRSATPTEPPVVPAPLPPIHYEARPENVGQVAMIPTPPSGQDVVPPLVKGLDDPIRYDPQPGAPPVHGVHLPDDPPTGSGTGFAVASTTGEGGAVPAAPPAVPPADFGNFLSPPTTQPPHAPAAPTAGGGAQGGAAPASGDAPPGGQASPSNGTGAQAPPSLAQAYAKLPLTFEANTGQTDKSVRYLARGPGYTLFLGNNDVNLSLVRPAQNPGSGGPRPQAPASVTFDNLAFHFAGADPAAKVVGLGDLQSRSNYFTGPSPDPAQTDIPNYGQVQVVGLYPGVNATYFGNAQGQLEYDLTVAPGADPSLIQLDFKGLKPLTLDASGNLQLRTAADTGTVVHQAPVIYQTVNGVRQTVTGHYVLENAHTAGFQIDSYDPTLPLVIDPVLMYSTYLGGSGTDAALGVAVDNAGQAYLTGYTTSTDFPTQNPFQSSNAGSTNAFVAKFGPTGSLIYASYLGGNGTDEGTGIAVDLAGNAYLAGTTTSTNFPTSSGAYQTTTNDADSFAAKLNATGDALVYSTLLGGSGNHLYNSTSAAAIAVGPTGSAYVTGVTTDSSFPTTVGAYKTSIGGSSNGFVVALNAAGTAASYATFLGGSTDGGAGIALDGSGDAFVTGNTNSGYPTTTGAYQTTYGLGTQDAFVTELNPSGSAQVYSTYLGGGSGDYAVGNAIAVDRAGNAYVTGTASATGYPTTGGSYQTGFGGGGDAFITKVNKAGSALTYSTFLGGSGSDTGAAIAVDLAGEATVTGQTYSTNFPTQSALTGQGSLPGTAAAFATRLNAAGSGLVFSSYLGGNGTDAGAGVATDLLGALYVVGQTTSTNFPTQNAFQGTNAGGTDAFLAKILVAVPPPVFTGISPDTGSSGSDQITTNQNLTISGTATPTSTVNLSRSDLGVIATGITTNATTGVWSYDYSGTTLAEATYAFTATAILSGKTSDPSHAFLVTVDRTAPTVTLTVPATTTSEGPQARVTVYDKIGVPANATVSIDVDFNADGNFTDTNETGYATGTLVNGVALITLYNAAHVLTTGTYSVRARVTDLAGNQGTSTTQSLQVTTVGSPWTMTGQVLRGDLEAGNLQLQLGNLSLSHPLDVDQSPGTGQSGNLALVYNSSETNVRPVIQVAIQSDNAAALPATITAQLTWAGGTAQTAVSYSTTGYYPGDVLTVAQQVSSAVSTTGRYGWSMKISITGRSDVTVTGSTYVVVEDGSPYGAGWTLSGIDQLVSIASDANGPAGVLRVYGAGGWRFYTDAGSGNYTSPAEDTGTLTKSGSTYTYTTPDGSTATFNNSGLLTSRVSPDGNETLAYRYNGSNAVTGVTAIDGALSTFTYASGLLSTVQAVGPRTYTLAFDGSSNLTQVTNPDGGLHTFSYDGNHHATGETFGKLANGWAYDSTFGTLATITYGNNTVATASTLSPAVVQGLAAPSTTTPKLARGSVQATLTDDLGYATTVTLDKDGRTLAQLAPDGSDTAYSLDSAGRPLTVNDPVGRVTSYAYDSKEYVTLTTLPDSNTIQDAYQSSFHALTQETDARGGLTTYSYDSSGHQTLMIDPTGARTTSTYTGGGLLQTVKDPLNHVSTYAYDSDRRETAVTNALSGIATTTYDGNGNVATSTDPNNHTTTYSNDQMGRTTLTTDALNHTTSTAYDPSDLPTSSTDQLGRVSNTTYDTTGRGLTVKTEAAVGKPADQTGLTSYNADGQTTATRDAAGAWANSYTDSMGRVTKTVNAQGASTQTDYDLDGEVVASRDALGRWSLTAYNSRGEATALTDALGNTTNFYFDQAGNQTKVTDPLSHSTSTSYDLDNRATVQTDALSHSVTTVFDLAGNVSTVTDARGTVTSYVYDALNRRTVETDAVGTGRQRTMTTAYDAAGNVTTQTDGLGHTTSFAYDTVNRQTTTTDPLSRITTTAYDAAANATTVTDPLNKVTSYTFDDLNRSVAVQDPLSHTSTTVLDPRGAGVGSIDPLSNVSQQGVDQLGRSVAGLDAVGDLSRTLYDDAGNVAAVIDANGNQTNYVYDGLNRVIKETSPTGGVTTSAYDAAGRKTQLLDPLSQEQDFTYDNANRLTQVVWKNSGGTAVNTLSYSYDNNGNMLTAQDTNGAYTTSYDELNRATLVQEPFGASLTYSYDAADRNTLVQDSASGVTSYVFDNGNRVTSVQFGGTGMTPLRLDLAYNNRDQVTTETCYKDLAGSNSVGSSTFAYDDAGRMTGITHKSATTTIDSFAYAYDSADRVTSETSSVGPTRTYTYDATGQLLGDGTNTWGYDPNGNRNTTGYQTGSGNQMTNDGTFTYTYDAKGELTKKSKGASLETWYYQYDVAGHLTLVSKHATDDGVGTADATYKETYKYDVLGNRQEMDVYASGDSGGATVTRFAYDRNGNAWADLNGSNALTMRRLYGQAVDMLFARIASGGTAAWYLTDRLGSVRDITDNVNGSVLDHLDYDGYGNTTTETNTGNGDRYKWTGREFDATTGLQYNRARYYDPKTGRWTSQDPMGFAAGDNNLYRYASNSPSNNSDPSGLQIIGIPLFFGVFIGGSTEDKGANIAERTIKKLSTEYRQKVGKIRTAEYYDTGNWEKLQKLNVADKVTTIFNDINDEWGKTFPKPVIDIFAYSWGVPVAIELGGKLANKKYNYKVRFMGLIDSVSAFSDRPVKQAMGGPISINYNVGTLWVGARTEAMQDVEHNRKLFQIPFTNPIIYLGARHIDKRYNIGHSDMDKSTMPAPSPYLDLRREAKLLNLPFVK